MTLEYCVIHGALRALVPAYAGVCPKLATLYLTGSSLWDIFPTRSHMEDEQDIIDIICSRARSRLSEDPEERTQRCLRYMNLLRGKFEERFSDVTLKKIRRLRDEYDIVITLEEDEEENECEHSVAARSRTFER